MLSNHQKTLRLQKKIFTALREEANLLLGRMPESIRQYERENQQDFKVNGRRLREINKFILLKFIKKADVTFIADFHAFDQAQRTALRIARDCLDPKIEWLLGLELIPSQFQGALDDFQKGVISLQAFHEKISYQEEWGFPWQNYAPLFDWAKENNVRLIALNRPKALYQPRDEQELHERDQWAAGVIVDLFAHAQNGTGSKLPKRKMLVLYGELHVGTRHLPLQLKLRSRDYLNKTLSCITIHQNEDRLFWQMAKKGRELTTEVVQLKRDVFCLFSSTPWAKFQSLVNWAENHALRSIDSKEGLDLTDGVEGGVDYLALIQSYGNNLAEFLGVEPPRYETLSICTIDQAHLLAQFDHDRRFTPLERKMIQFYVANNHRFYVPHVSIAYLGTSSSPNVVAELAALHLMMSRYHPAPAQNLPEIPGLIPNIFDFKRPGFYRAVLESAFGFFGSLVIHPKRKCDLPRDHQLRLIELGKNKTELFPGELRARQITLELLSAPVTHEFNFKRREAPAILMAAKYIGNILAVHLHAKLIAGDLPVSGITDLFLGPLTKDELFFEDRFHTLLKYSMPIDRTTSKQDRL